MYRIPYSDVQQDSHVVAILSMKPPEKLPLTLKTSSESHK